MTPAHQSLQTVDQGLLLFDLFLLLLDCVNQDRTDAVVFDAFDFALFVVSDEQRFDRRDLFGTKAEVVHPALLPIKSDRTKTIENRQSANEALNVCLVTQ